MNTLYLVSTPIGHLDDISLRSIKTLFSVDYIACEDTRRTGQLLNDYELRIKNQELMIKGIDISHKPKLLSYYDEIEFKRIPEIISLLESGLDVALVSDAGTPLVSDPGFKLVRECIMRKIRVISIPGPSSVITALTLSGLPPNDFRFIGYLPPNKTKRRKLLEGIKLGLNSGKQSYTVIAFDTAIRLNESLNDIQTVFGDIQVVICRELTKIHEEVIKGKISEILSSIGTIKGEITILL